MFPFEADEDGPQLRFDPEESFLRGSILADHVFWDIHIEWVDPEYHEHSLRFAWIEIEDMIFPVSDWRDLEGQEVRAVYVDEDEDEPNLSPVHACFFQGEHETPEDNHVRLSERQGRTFLVEWSGVLFWEKAPFSFSERVALTEITVFFPLPADVDVEAARQIVSKHLDLSEVGDVRVSDNHVQFTIRPDVK